MLRAALLLLTIAQAAGVSAIGADARDTSIELNRLEQHESGCRVHLVLANAGVQAYSDYRLDLVVFGNDGVIARRLALDAGPLRAGKTTVKVFELSDLACAGVGRILLNDISRCTTAEGDMPDCVTAARLSSRAAASFVK